MATSKLDIYDDLDGDDRTLADEVDSVSDTKQAGGIKTFVKRHWLFAVILLPIAIAVLYVSIALSISKINDDTSFAVAADKITTNGSYTVDLLAALIQRETSDNAWPANDPWFLPGHWIDNMPNFQIGMFGSFTRFTQELRDQLGRTRGSSRVDTDLERAAGNIAYAPDTWILRGGAPVIPAENMYLDARTSLLEYNKRLANGQATYERRVDNLVALVGRITNDLGSDSAVIYDHLRNHAGLPFDTKTDDVFYQTKGKMYGYYMILNGLGQDFAEITANNRVSAVWNQMMETLKKGAEIRPFIVMNGKPDSQIWPSHLSAQGFYLLRARTQMEEVMSVLPNN